MNLKNSFARVLPLTALCLAAVMPVTFTSCGDDDEPSEKDGNGGEVIPGVTGDEALSPQEQKETLEKVGIALLDEINAADFGSLKDVVEYAADHYADGKYATGAIDRWYDACLEALSKTDEGTTTTTDRYDYGSEGWKSTYIYEYTYHDYRTLYLASNFTGHFEAGATGWTYTPSKDDLQFTFKDGAGRTCVLKLTTGGKVKPVYMGTSEHWKWLEEDSEMDYDNNVYHWVYLINREKRIYGIPEKAEVTLTQGGNVIAKAVVTTDLSSMASENYDLSKDSYSANATLEVAGYAWTVDRLAYTADKHATLTYGFRHGSTNLITMSLSADGKFGTEGTEGTKKVVVDIDVMNSVQLKGTLADAGRFVDYLDEAERNDENELGFKSYISQANGLLDLGLYFNNGSARQGDVRLEPFAERYGSYSYWTYEPVICFEDGTSYSTFSAFFNQKDFRSLINQFEKLADEFSDLY